MNNQELTELPELPNDAFWRISEYKSSGYGMFFGRTGAYIAVVVPTRVDKVVPKEIKLPFGITFKYGSKTDSTFSNEEVVRIFITKKTTIDSDVFDDDDNIIGVKERAEEVTVDGDDLTPELILEAAKVAHERYLDILKSRHFLGDYPPKSLAKVIQENS